jgi:hypothetical protein
MANMSLMPYQFLRLLLFRLLSFLDILAHFRLILCLYLLH